MYVFQVSELMEMSLTYFLAFQSFKLLIFSGYIHILNNLVWNLKKKLYDMWLNFTDNHDINRGLFVLLLLF